MPTSRSRPASRCVYADYVKLMFDLQVLAFQTDSTRVATMMIGREGSIRTYPEIGVPDPHHPLTHHRNNTEWIEKVTQINAIHMELFAQFLEKLKDTPDGDGSLLDHSMIVYGSGIERRQPPHARRPAGAAARRRRRLPPRAATSSIRRTRR